MEGIKENLKSEEHLTSAAAFVEGGIQDACDDACSICLEAFCDSDPSTVTCCKHEFHLQCILEWCQRSSQCPMCWQTISLKDPTSQELLVAVEHERTFRFNPSRNVAIFHHPALGDFELQHLPVGTSDSELEERIIQHLAAAADMGRRHIARRESQRNRSSAHSRPQLLVFSSNQNLSSSDPVSSSPAQGGEGEFVSPITAVPPSSLPANTTEGSSPLITPLSSDTPASSASPLANGFGIFGTNQNGSPLNNRSSSHSSPDDQNIAGPSEFQSISVSIKSRLNAMSMRCKESISKSARGWKERLFSRNTTMADLGPEVKRDVNAGIAIVSRMMEHLEARDNSRTSTSSVPTRVEDGLFIESNNMQMPETRGGISTGDNGINVPASCTASSGSSRVQSQQLHQ